MEILKIYYYAGLLVFICLPALFMIGDNLTQLILTFINICMMLGAFFLISGKTDQEYIQFRFDTFEAERKIRSQIEKSLKATQRPKQQKSKKHR